MSDAETLRSVEKMRREFDEAFARPIADAPEPEVELLAIRVHDDELALRASDAAGIMRCPVLVPMPSNKAALLGLAGVRGTLVAVYSLAALLGAPPRPPRPGGWIAICRSDRSAAVWFPDLVGLVRVSASEIHASSPGSAFVSAGSSRRTLIDITSLLRTIGTTAGED